jgi:hypothetical protein
MVGGPTGTLVDHFRDSILCVQENPLCVGGDGFTVPTNAGNIRALCHSANINSQLGEGVLYISTRKTIYSLAVPVTRTDWIGANSTNQPLQTVVQLVNGAVGDRSVVVVNGDIFYQSLEPAIRSLQISVRNFGQWGNTPISQNELRALAANDRGLMRFSSGIQFDNRMLQLVLPVMASTGLNVVHQAILPLDFDVVSNLSTQGPTNVSGTSAVRPPVWEGAYDGLQFLQLFERDFGGLHRGFAVVISEMDGGIDIWELTTTSRTENGDNRVTWGAEYPAFTWSPSGLEVKLKQLKGGECWIDSVSGTVDMDVWYREDADPCWRYWFHTQFCAARGCQEAEPVCVNPYPPVPFREGYRYPIVFPEPKAACDSMGIRPTTIGYQFQVKVILKGWCQVRGLILYAIPHSEPQYHGIACPDSSSVPQGMAKIMPWGASGGGIIPTPPSPIPPPTPPVPPTPPPTVFIPVNSGVPTITGTAQVGFTLSGTDGTWTNSPTGYSYRWLANGVAIGGATNNMFLLTSAQLGAVITFEVTAYNSAGNSAPVTSVATSAVLPAVPVNSVLPVVSGTAQVGQVLSSTNGTWTNSPTGYTYQWFSNGVPIAGQIANVFTPTSAQVGEVITIEVTASNSGGNSSPAASVATSAVLPAVPVNSVLPAITGTAQEGETLSGSNGTWSNSPTGYAYRWLANSVAIGGATASTFLLTSTQIGATITFEVTASNAGGSGTPATSSATGAVLPAVPVNTVVPAITGTAQVGETLSGSDGTWTNTPTSYAYEWLANGTPIGGATANTFLLTGAQLGEVITFQVTASNAGGSGSPATSTATSAVTAPLNPLATDWSTRVVANGGAVPSGATVLAISDFSDALDAASLTSKMTAVNCFAPDSIIAALTPLIVGPGNDPWINHNNEFNAGDLTVNGLVGDGATKWLLTGVHPSSISGQPNSGGYTIYFYTCPSEASTDLAVYLNPDQAGLFNISGTVVFDCWNSAAGATTVSLPGFTGYVSGNRVSASETHIYAANSGTAHYSAAGNSGAPGTAPNAELWAWAMNATGSPLYLSTKRLSFIAIHQGLTAAESLNFYNAVQALRTALGGGMV